MQKEMHSIHLNDIWDLVELPKDRKPIGCKWVFKKKTKSDGSIERYKARLVAQGFSQKQGLDYDEMFSPVIQFESFRTLVAIAVQKGLKLHQLDITAAFFNGRLEEEVFMKQPEVIFKDNQSAISMATNPQYHGRTKHINIKYHFRSRMEQFASNTAKQKICWQTYLQKV